MELLLVYFIVIKTVIKLFSTGCRRVSSRGLVTSRGWWGWGVGGREKWRGLELRDSLQLAKQSTRMLVSSSFKHLRTFVIVPNVLIKFSKIRNVFFSDVVYDVNISWYYILLSATDNFGLGKWAKIERNDDKLLRVKTSLVRKVSQWNNTPESYGHLSQVYLLLKLSGMTALSTVFP